MLTRFLGGVAACLGAVSVAAGQSPTPTVLPRTRPVLAAPAKAVNTDVGSPLVAQPTSQSAARPNSVMMPPASRPSAISTQVGDPMAGVAIPAAETLPMGVPSVVPQGTQFQNLLATGGHGVTSVPTYGSCATECLTECPEPCGPPGRFWIDAGYWYGTITGQRAPALATAAPAGTPRNQAGALGQPGTSVLYPPGRVNDDWRSGFYLNAGMWLDQGQRTGIEGNFFYLGESSENFTAGSDGSQIITRPFFNTQLGQQDTQLVSFPNILAGSVNVQSRSNFVGGGPNFIRNLCCGPCGRFDLLLGYQYIRLDDEINIVENLRSLPGQTNVTPGTTFIVRDNFRTTNDIHGFNIGFATERRFSHWYFGLRAGVLLGVNNRTVDINGSTTITSPGGTAQTFAGGLLTQPSNIGRYSDSEFTAVPWVGLKLGCQITPRMRAYVGYDFMYLSNVVRAGDQIDLRVNPTQIPPRNNQTGEAFPRFNLRETGASVNAIRVGIELRF
jgi:Putative beta barrel porin-7 (BBP7)